MLIIPTLKICLCAPVIAVSHGAEGFLWGWGIP